MKKYNINNVKWCLAGAIKKAGLTPAEAVAAAKANGRGALTDATIEAALADKGWTAGGDNGGSMIEVGGVAESADVLAARDLLAWMLAK